MALNVASWATMAAQPQPLSDDVLAGIHFEQKLGNQISLDLAFRDEAGRKVLLRNYAGKKPILLNLGYYECPMMCGLVLNGMVESMQDLRWTIGNEFEVVHISIDPRETPALAAGKKRSCMKRYGRDRANDGWHFLTGQKDAIETVSREIGFQYAYDPVSKQYAHPSGFVVLTPDGRISRYFLGMTYSARDLQQAISAASTRTIGSRIQELVLLCFHYRPITSKYGAAIMITVRTMGVMTVVTLTALIVSMSRAKKAKM
jgi:protein SCO1/2